MHTINVAWSVPWDNQDKQLHHIYTKLRSIYRKIYSEHPCNKWDLLKKYSIPIYMYPITYNETKFYAMPEFSRDVGKMLRTSLIKNPITNHNMLPMDDLILFCDRLVNICQILLHYICTKLSILYPTSIFRSMW